MLLFSFAIIPVYALDGQNVNFDLHSIVYDEMCIRDSCKS